MKPTARYFPISAQGPLVNVESGSSFAEIYYAHLQQLPAHHPQTRQPRRCILAIAMPLSERQLAANRANARKSRGPVTAAGKARSSANAVTHGLASTGRATQSVCLVDEDRGEFMRLYESFVREFAPVSSLEHQTVHQMAEIQWRLARSVVYETALLDHQADCMAPGIEAAYDSIDGATRGALAFQELAGHGGGFTNLGRYETRLERQFDRLLARLYRLQNAREKRKFPNDPIPGNGHFFLQTADDDEVEVTHADPTPVEETHPPAAAAQPEQLNRLGPIVRPITAAPPPPALAPLHLQTQPLDPHPSPGDAAGPQGNL